MKRVQNREKLSKPQLCPDDVYAIMMECWKIDARVRISATDIENRLKAVGYSESLVWPSQPRQLTAVKLDGPVIDEAAFLLLEISPQAIKLGKLLGEGEYGSVYKGVFTTTSQRTVDVAVKTVKSSCTDFARAQFMAEAKLLASLHHINIISVLAVCFKATEEQLIVLELMTGGDLLEYIKDNQQTLKNEVSQLSYAVLQVAEAMMYLSARKVLHRDLAARFVFTFMYILYL